MPQSRTLYVGMDVHGQFLVPPLLQAAQRRRGYPRRLGSQQRLEGLREIPRRDALQVQPGQEGLEAFGATHRGGKEGGVKLSPRTATITHPGHLHPDGVNTRLDVALWERAVLYDRVPALGISAVGILGEQQDDFRFIQPPQFFSVSEARS